MKSKSLFHTFTAALVLATATLTMPVMAEDGANPAEQQQQQQQKVSQQPFQGKLAAVDKDGMTITLDGKLNKRTFTVAQAAKITKNGNPATLADAAVGEEVGGLARKNAEGKLEVVSLRIGPKATKEASAKPADDAAKVQ